MNWQEISQEEYSEKFNLIAPKYINPIGFLMGEPQRYTEENQGVYPAYIHYKGKYWGGVNLTVNQFIMFNHSDLPSV